MRVCVHRRRTFKTGKVVFSDILDILDSNYLDVFAAFVPSKLVSLGRVFLDKDSGHSLFVRCLVVGG